MSRDIVGRVLFLRINLKHKTRYFLLIFRRILRKTREFIDTLVGVKGSSVGRSLVCVSNISQDIFFLFVGEYLRGCRGIVGRAFSFVCVKRRGVRPLANEREGKEKGGRREGEEVRCIGEKAKKGCVRGRKRKEEVCVRERHAGGGVRGGEVRTPGDKA